MTAETATYEEPGERVRVLIVDDSAEFRHAAASVVESTTGFAVAALGCSGEEAVGLARRLRPDLVLMDVRMPGAGGIEAARAIVTARPQIVVVLMSAETGIDLHASAVSCGAAAAVHKRELRPVLLQELWRRHAPRQAGTRTLVD